MLLGRSLAPFVHRVCEAFHCSQLVSTFHSSSQLLSMMEQRNKRGAFIVFEGLDRSGKTTQVDRLLQSIDEMKESYPHLGMRFPDRTPTNPINIEICDYLSKKKELSAKGAHLLFTKQRRNQKSDMENCLRQGIILIVDRYSHSGAAYSAAKDIPLDWCMAQEEGLLEPDLVVFMDLPPVGAGKRSGFGDERYETIPYQTKVYEQYMKLYDPKNWLKVDATKTEDQVAEKVLEKVLDVIKGCSEKPIRYFGEQQEDKCYSRLASPLARQCTPTKAQESSKEPAVSLVECRVKC